MPRQPEPTQLQRHLIGKLVLAGNARVELHRQAALAERELRLALVHCWLAGITNRRVLAGAAQIAVRTVYSWLNVEGLQTGKHELHWIKAARHPVLNLSREEIDALRAEYQQENDRELSARLTTDY